MDIQKIVNQLKELKEISETDEEMAHIEADNILIEILKHYQLNDIIDAYKINPQILLNDNFTDTFKKYL